MALTRRRLLGAGVGVASGLLGGCTRRNPLDSVLNDGGTGPPGETGTPGSGSGAGESTTATATATRTSSVGAAGSATDRVYDELTWFATEYRPTVDRYLSTAARARSLIGTLERRSSVGTDDVERLRALLARVERLVYEGLVPHFDAEPTVRSFNEEHLERLSTLRERGDWDGVQRVLGTMEERYRRLSSESYVTDTFPVDPIRGPFARMLTADGATAETAVVCYFPSADYLTRVQADVNAYDGGLAGGRTDVQEYEQLLGPVTVVASRESLAYLTYTSLTHGMESRPVFVQRYSDAEGADGAVRRMLSASGSVTADGTATLGGSEWRQIYYQAAGGVTYAHLRRTGRYLLTIAPTRTPWDERPSNWTTALKQAWFWE